MRNSVWLFTEAIFPSSHQPIDFFSGKIGLSGTDGTFLRVALKLSDAGHAVSLFNREWDDAYRNLEFVRINTATDLKPGESKPNPDILIFQCSYESARELLVLLPGVRKLFWDHIGVDYRFLELIAARKIDELICVSESAREFYRSTSAYPYTRSIYNLSGDIYLEPKPREPDGRTISFVGALRPEKGFDRLALAWPIVHAAFPTARLAVAGSISLHNPAAGSASLATGDYQTDVIGPFQNWAKSAGAEVDFLGAIGASGLIELHSKSVACVVNPYGGETFCCSAVEAQLCGCPVVSVRSGALPEVTEDGITSLLVEKGSPQALAEAILRLLRNPTEVAAMDVAARKRACALFGPDPIMDAWEGALLAHPPSINPLGRAPFGTRIRRNLLRATGVGDLLRRKRDARRADSR